MTTVNKEINEVSDKIKHVRKIVSKRKEKVEDKVLIPTPISEDSLWREFPISFPNKTVRIGSVFSGIGAVEHAFQRLGIKHQIMFAGDIEPRCKQSYFANYSINESDWFTDVREFDATKYLGEVDLVVLHVKHFPQ